MPLFNKLPAETTKKIESRIGKAAFAAAIGVVAVGFIVADRSANPQPTPEAMPAEHATAAAAQAVPETKGAAMNMPTPDDSEQSRAVAAHAKAMKHAQEEGLREWAKLDAQLSAPPATPSPVATGIATFIAYDVNCASMPQVFRDMTGTVSAMIPPDILDAAMNEVISFYHAAGPAKFCALNKPVVENAMASFRP